jgi:ATP-dependent Lon protease
MTAMLATSKQRPHPAGPQKPRKYKLKNESESVKRFVKLVQTDTEPDEGDIDRDITFFKSLTPGAQDKLLTKLKNKVEPVETAVPLRFQIMMKDVPSEVERVALAKYQAMMNIDPSSTEYYKSSQWIHGYTRLPLGVYRDLPVKLEDGTEPCQQFVSGVRKHMDTAIYGHEEAKLQILQFVSSWIANPKAAGNVLSIHGPPGVGKTTLIKDGVAKALERPFHFITLGGATDASYLDGHSYTYEGSVWGKIVDVLMKSKCMNPVIYFDELDKVSETPKGEEINNLLIHLTDGSQNDRFQDKYFTGIDLNLSRCLFIFSHNAHDKINPILRDRMYNIQVEGFNTKEKLAIAEQYLVPEALKEVGLYEKVGIGASVLKHIIENLTGEEKGVRELKRCIQTIVSKLNLLRFYNDPARVPFAIKGFALPFNVGVEHVDVLLKKKAPMDSSIAHLYM